MAELHGVSDIQGNWGNISDVPCFLGKFGGTASDCEKKGGGSGT